MRLNQWAGRLEKILARLPGPIRASVEQEWRPLKELFLERRPPRLLLAGDAEVLREMLLPPAEDALPEPAAPGWHTVRRRGALEWAATGPRGEGARAALAQAACDCVIFFAAPDAGEEAALLLRELGGYARQRHGEAPPLVVVRAEGNAYPWEEEAAATVPAGRRDALLDAIVHLLPEPARLEFARATGEKAVQREIAELLTRSAATVCTAIGLQPIPLADLPVLTSIQVALVAGIVHASGREWSLGTARDFLGAAGLNVGAAFALREGARAAVKLLPGWGNAISGAVAGAGTYAVGRAATAFFIDGLPLGQVRRTLRLKMKRRG